MENTLQEYTRVELSYCEHCQQEVSIDDTTHHGKARVCNECCSEILKEQEELEIEKEEKICA